MSNVDINVDRRMDGLTDGRTENRTPISHPATSRCDKNENLLIPKQAENLNFRALLFKTNDVIS